MNKKGIQKKIDFELVVVEAEPRVDSRLIARRLGIKHKNTFELIKRHQERFENFGLLTFETEAV